MEYRSTMEFYLSHQTASTYWHSPYAERRDANGALPSLPSSFVPMHAFDPEMLVRRGLDEPPYHVAVANEALRGHDPQVVPHIMGGAIPAGSFQPLRGELWVATPELTFVQMAGELDLAGTVKLGYELCAGYVISELFGRPEERDPLTSPAALREYVARSGNRAGIKTARRAVRYVRSGAESPMEVAVSMLLTLPRMYGGYGLPAAVLNPDITVRSRAGGGAQTAKGAKPAKTYRCDLVWPRQRVIVEYDSDLHHSRKAELTRDTLRRNALQDAGWRVVGMTASQVYDEAAMDDAAAQLARALGVHGNGTEPRGMLVRRAALRELVLG